MAHLVNLHKEAPLASEDELTPSLESVLQDQPRSRHPIKSDNTDPISKSYGKMESTPETATPEEDNTDTLEKQPIYAQVTKKSERKQQQPKTDENEDEEMKKEKVTKDKDQNKKSIPSRVTVMPKHRSRCVACGCPRICCVKNFIFLWVVFFILLQGGPLAVLVLDFISIKSEGTTISRYIAEWNMKPAMCRVQDYSTVDLTSCDCYSSNKQCEAPITGYSCITARVNVYNHTGSVANKIFLWRSEKEYVLDTFAPHCFNLDICKIDKTKTWYDYRNQTKRDEHILQEKMRLGQGFVCYYKMNRNEYVAIMEMNTSFWQVLIWFFLPLSGILICWLMVFICLCWYCCPRQKSHQQAGKKERKNYSHVGNDENAEGYHDPEAVKEALNLFPDEGGHLQAGKWPMSGPAAACDM